MIGPRVQGWRALLAMAKDGKFGTFGGVFTPSILTILGVIMYLRLPWLVGSAGLTTALIVILVAHVVSITTGLSISSIATDKKVGAGGPYYIISRSFGLPIGGAVGSALFLGLCFSISLYLVGFSESFLASIGIEPTKNAIRVCGTITITTLAIITFISTSLAIKTQYVILMFIAGSLLSVLIGKPSAAEPLISTPDGAPSFAVFFGIFFPAVTGFTAGVNMSGDLRDPKGSIPRGTMAAIGTGLVVYVGLAVFLAYRVDADVLRNDPRALESAARINWLVIAGIWSATLSSALGSLLGAPRILQAMSGDRITPRVFAKGFGPTNEPRNALYLAFAIGEGGILIAELDVIARVVSMVFLAMYGVVNLTCAIESWASADFRPKFRIPKTLSIIGAVTCALLMIQLDLMAMIGAAIFMLFIYGYLQRKQLTLESGDTWDGIWSTIVRTGLHRLHKRAGPRRNWRPNVLLFDEAGHERHHAIRSFAATLASGNGIVTDFALGEDFELEATHVTADERSAGVFERTLVTGNRLDTVATLCRYHGFSGLEPNTVLLPWRERVGHPEEYLAALRAAAESGLNILVFEAGHHEPSARPQIHVWWSREAGNLALSVSLLRFVTRAEAWDRSEITVFIVADDVEEDELLRAKAEHFLADTRLDAVVRLVAHPGAHGSHHDLVVRESRDADLVLVGLPDDIKNASETTLADLEEISALPSGVVFLRASDSFRDVLTPSAAKRAGQTGRADSVDGVSPDIASATLDWPRHEELAEVARAMHEHLRATLSRIHTRLITRVYKSHMSLCDSASLLLQERADAMIAAANEPNPSKRKRLAQNAAHRFLEQTNDLLEQFERDDIEAIATLVAEEMEALLGEGAALDETIPPQLRIHRPRAEFRSQDGDALSLRQWKRRKRLRWFYRRRIPQTIATGDLARRNHDRLICDAVSGAVARFRGDSQELVLEVGRLLTRVEWKALAQLARGELQAPEQVIEKLEASRKTGLGRLAEMRTHARERIAVFRESSGQIVLDLSRNLCSDLDRVDAPEIARAARKRDKRDLATLAAMPGVAEDWRVRQSALLKRVRLSARISGVRGQLTLITVRHVDEIAEGVRASGGRICQMMRGGLAAGIGDEKAVPPEVPDELPYDASPIVARFARAAAGATGELAESESFLSDQSAAELGRGGSIEVVNLPVRSAVQALVEAELITRLQSETGKLTEIDARSWTVARDTERLVASAQAGAADAEEDEEVSADTTAAHGIERIDAQIERLGDAEQTFVAAVFEGLDAVASATGLDRLASSLEAMSKLTRGTERPSRARQLARRGADRIRQLAARAVYRRSAGVVFAHRTRAAEERAAVHALRELTRQSAADPDVLAAVPLSYRHLFTGQTNINEAFFVGRRDRVAEAVAALRAEDRGGAAAVLVSGERGSGKTTLCQQIITTMGRRSYWVSPPPAGSAARADLRAALRSALGGRGTAAQALARLEVGSVVVFDDVDLWWERRQGGLDAIEDLIEIVTSARDNVGFVLAGSSQTVRMLDAVRGLSQATSKHLVCEPLTAQQLQEIVMKRHESTGVHLKLGRRSESSLGAWSRARLFDSYFAYSRGNVAYALRAWVAHVDEYADDTLEIRLPRVLDWDAIDDLPAEHIALLIELLLHKSAAVGKLERVTGRAASDIRQALGELSSMGLITINRRRLAQINPFVLVPVIDWLQRRELV